MPMKRIVISILALSGLAVLTWWGSSRWSGESEPAEVVQAREIEWEELIPEDARGYDMYASTIQGQLQSQVVNPGPQPTGTEVVEELNNQQVRLPGYVVPLTGDGPGTVEEFLLVPYMGACIHLPPPPPNQIVYVELSEPFELQSMWEPFWINGTMRVESQHLGIASAAYTIKGATMDSYFTEEG